MSWYSANLRKSFTWISYNHKIPVGYLNFVPPKLAICEGEKVAEKEIKMQISRRIAFNLFITSTSKFRRDYFVKHVKNVICKSGPDSSRKEVRLKVEACCVPCVCAFLLLLCTVGLVVLWGLHLHQCKLVGLIPGGTRAY